MYNLAWTTSSCFIAHLRSLLNLAVLTVCNNQDSEFKVFHFSVKSFSFRFCSAGFCFLNCPLLSFVWVVAFQSFDKVIHGGFSLSEIPGWLHGLFGGVCLVGLFCILVLLIFLFSVFKCHTNIILYAFATVLLPLSHSY